MIYGFAGKAQSGKDTCAKIWQSLDGYYNHPVKVRMEDIDYVKRRLENPLLLHNSSWQQKAFATKPKQIICIITGCTMSQLEDEEFLNSKVPEWMKLYHLPGQGVSTSKFTVCGQESFVLHRTYNELFSYLRNNLLCDSLHPYSHINMLMQDYKPNNVDNIADILEELHFKTLTFPKWLISDVKSLSEIEIIRENKGKVIGVSIIDNGKYDYIINIDSDIDELIIDIKNIMIIEKIISVNNEK